MTSEGSHNPFQISNRLEAFSDGVFAIVITLLVIELKLPEVHDPTSASDLFHRLWDIRAHLWSYFICFFFVGQLWVAHARFFRFVKKTDSVVAWLNILLMMAVCLQPFVTGILGEYPDNPGSVLIFGILFSATGAIFSPMSWYCRFKGYFDPRIDPIGMDRGIKIASGIGLISLLPLTFVYVSPRLALLFYVFLMIGYIWVETQFRIRMLGDGEEGEPK